MGLFSVFVVLYLIIMIYLGNKYYKEINVFYRPLYYKKDKKDKQLSVHELYPEFRVYDKLSYTRTILGFIFLVPIRIFGQFLVCSLMSIHLKFLLLICHKNYSTIPEEMAKFDFAIKFWAHAFLIAQGTRIVSRSFEYEKVYKKYLGDDYFTNQKEENYSLIICNHTGYYVR